MEALAKASTEEHQSKEAKSKEAQRDRKERNDWLFVMLSDQGFRVLMEIMRFSKMEENPLGGADREVFYRIGRQEMGRYVKKKMLETDRRRYLEMELKLGEQDE
jgi:hypothetical protein